MCSRKLVYFVTEDWYFCSHRLPLAVAAKNSGYQVTVITRVRSHGERIREAGLTLIPFEIARGGINPFAEFGTLLRLVAAYRKIRPDIVHHVSMKPVLYGSIAARIARVPSVVNAITGMGWIFTSGSGLTRRFIQKLVRAALVRLLGPSKTIVQNADDAELLTRLGLSPGRLVCIRGSGVDLVRFRPSPPAKGPVTVVMAARLLWDKGIREFVDAARLLKQRGVKARLVIAGEPDELNRAMVPAGDIKAWTAEGVVEHLGWIEDMAGLLENCHIVCLPSYYREGLPKSLLEGAAAGLPIVTTDTPGCREIVRDPINGFLVPPRDARAVADALEKLINNQSLRETMGAEGRSIAEKEFGIEAVVRQTLEIYEGISN